MMRSALADVGLDKRLGRSASGLDTTLQGSRSRFSGGELPRLLLAPVLLRPPVLAILDEDTGALDAGSELDLHSAFRLPFPQPALVVVSPRTRPPDIPPQY